MVRQIVAALVIAGALVLPAGHLLSGTADASNSVTFPATCPGFGDVMVTVNGNGAVGHAVVNGQHLVGINLGTRGNAGTTLADRLVTCDSAFGPIVVFFPAGR